MRQLEPVLYVGGKESDNRKKLNYFESRPECRAFLTTRQKGGEGLNLQVANHLILLNYWYTVKDIIQILGRIKRKGQKKPIHFYILCYNLFECLGPGKEKEDYILEEDKQFYEAVIGKAEMYEQWGIRVKEELPKMKVFYKFSSFEEEFNDFLNTTIIKDHTHERIDSIHYGEQSKLVIEEDEIELPVKEIIKFGESYLSSMYSEYTKRIPITANQQSKETRRKVVVVKRWTKKT